MTQGRLKVSHYITVQLSFGFFCLGEPLLENHCILGGKISPGLGGGGGGGGGGSPWARGYPLWASDVLNSIPFGALHDSNYGTPG